MSLLTWSRGRRDEEIWAARVAKKRGEPRHIVSMFVRMARFTNWGIVRHQQQSARVTP